MGSDLERNKVAPGDVTTIILFISVQFSCVVCDFHSVLHAFLYTHISTHYGQAVMAEALGTHTSTTT